MILLDKKELLDVAENFLLVASQVATLFLMMGVGYVLAKTERKNLRSYMFVVCHFVEFLFMVCKNSANSMKSKMLS